MWRNSLRIFVLLWIARLLIESRTTSAFRSGCPRMRNSTFSMMFSSIVGLSTMIAWGCRFAWDIMIWLTQSTNQMWSIGIWAAAARPVTGHAAGAGEGRRDAPLGVAVLGRPNLGDGEGRAPLRAQDGPQAKEEVSDPLLLSDAVADRGHGIEDQAADLLLLHDPGDRVREEPGLVEIEVLLVDAELVVDLREVDELELALPDELVVEEGVRDDVHQELVR